MNTWVTSSGKEIPVTAMKDSHLANAIGVVEKILQKPGKRPSYEEKLRMLMNEKMRRMNTVEHHVWCKLATGGSKAHLVYEYESGMLALSARCGYRPNRRKSSWLKYAGDGGVGDLCQTCAALGAGTSPVDHPILPTAEEEVETLKVEVAEVSMNYLQTVGPGAPLCWIPVDDVKAVVMLLAAHKPSSESLRIVQAQFDMVIGHLNQYIQEAQDRNVKGGLVSLTYTTPSGEKTKKDK